MGQNRLRSWLRGRMGPPSITPGTEPEITLPTHTELVLNAA